MTTTDQRTSEAEPTRAEDAGWAVPGVDRPAAAPGSPVSSVAGATDGVDRCGAGASDAAAHLDTCADPDADAADAADSDAADSTRPIPTPPDSDAADSDAGDTGSTGGDGPSLLHREMAAAGGSVHPVVTALLGCLEALESVRGVSAATLTAREIRLMLLAVVQVITVAFAVKMKLLVAGEVQRVGDLTGATSTAAFFAHLTQTRRADASALVRLARDLDRRYPVLAEALEAGQVSPDQVAVCVAALRKLPKDLPGDQLAKAQRFLVEAAQSLAPDKLRAVGRKLWEVIDPEGAEAKEGKALEDEEELARAKAYFRSWRNGDGTTGFRGKLPDLQADMLIKAIQAFASPRRRSNPNIPTSQPDDIRHPDTNPAGASGSGDPERATAGGVAADGRGGREKGAAPGTGGVSPEQEPGNRPLVDADEDEDFEETESPEERETGRVIPYPVKLGHGLMDLIERIPADLLPSSGGVAAVVNITMRLDQLRSGLGVATVDTGIEASASQVRRLACEAGLVPIVLGGESEILDVGREKRLHTKGQRRGMAVRDGKCVTEGCDRPAAWTEAHHPVTWEDGGETSLENGASVCPYHHRLWHSPKWQAIWNGRTVRFRRRRATDPAQTTDSGSDLPTRLRRTTGRVAAIRRSSCTECASGEETIAGTPASPPSRSATSSGTWPSSGASMVRASSSPPPEPNSAVDSWHDPHTRADMFSTTPATGIRALRAIRPTRSATVRAAGCGVVTAISAASGTSSSRDMVMSPVPGGRSMSRASSSPQWTSPRNCSSALWSIGPRHTTGSSSLTKKPTDISETPWASTGSISPLMAIGARRTPNRCGIE